MRSSTVRGHEVPEMEHPQCVAVGHIGQCGATQVSSHEAPGMTQATSVSGSLTLEKIWNDTSER